MADHKAKISWQRGSETFTDNKYSRAHQWQFDEGVVVQASASPHIVPTPFSNPAAVDPEEAFTASLSSCHMLWFLSIAAKNNFCVDSYVDEAFGMMEKDVNGRAYISKVVLHPQTTFSGNHVPSAEEIKFMHHEAHKECFIANSVKTEVQCIPMV